MMKNVLMHCIILLALCLVADYAAGQDAIFKTDGQKIDVKVLSVSDSEVRFKKTANLDGPEYILNTKEILMISYENGTFDILNEKNATAAGESSGDISIEKTDPFLTDFERNLISFDVFQIISENMGFIYENVLSSGKFGVYIPLTFGLGLSNGGEGPFGKSMLYSVGLGLNYYPTGQKRIAYYTGLEVTAGEYFVQECTSFETMDEWGNIFWDGICTQSSRKVLTTSVGNGLRFQVTKNFNVGGKILVGLENSLNGHGTGSSVRLMSNMIVRF